MVIYRQIKEGGLDYRAMSLVYTSLLALIPLLAVSFSVLKAFGAEAYLEPLIKEMLKPLSGNTQAVTEQLFASVKSLDVGLLGSIGLLSLLYTSISLLDKIEDSFNHIWRRGGKTSRSMWRRFSGYVSFVLIGPLLVFSAFGGINELLQRAAEFHWLKGGMNLVLPLIQALLPYAFIIVAFALLYKLLPDARVDMRSAWFGGLIAGLSWKMEGWIFASFMAGSADYHAVYSTFAILILFMIWLYLSWLLVLVGAQIVFFHQHPRYLAVRNAQARLSGRMFERLGLLVMVLIGRRFFRGEPPLRVQDLAERLALPDDWVDELVSVLSEKGYVMPAGQEGGAVAPARDLSTISLMDVLEVLRAAHEQDFPLSLSLLTEPEVDSLMGRFDGAVREVIAKQTVLDLILKGEA